MKNKGQPLNLRKIEPLASLFVGLREGSRFGILGTHRRGFNSPQVHQFNAPPIAGNYRRGGSRAEAKRTGFLGPPSFSLSDLKKAREKMTRHNCRIECRKFGKTHKGQQRYRCSNAIRRIPILVTSTWEGCIRRLKNGSVINLLVEGCSIRSIQRLTGIDQNTIMTILVFVGNAVSDYLRASAETCPCPMFNAMKFGVSWAARKSTTEQEI